MKRVLIFCIAILFIFAAFAGCSNKNIVEQSGDTTQETKADPAEAADADTEEPQESSEPVELRLAWWGGQSRHDKMISIAEKYMEMNTNVDIQCEFSGYSDHMDKLMAQIAGGNAPDMFWLTIRELALMAEKDVFLDLDPYVGDVIDMSTVDQSIIDVGTVDGNLFCIANGVNTSSMLFDPDIFESAGVEPPEISWTWEDLVSIGATIHEKLDIYALETPPTGETQFHYFVRQNGYEWYSEDGKSLGFTDQSIAEEYFALCLELMEKGLCPTPDELLQTSAQEDKLLPKGEAATQFTDSNQITTQSAVAKKPLDFLIMPGPNNEDGMFIKPSCFIAGYSGTEYPEEVAKYFEYFLNDPVAGGIFKGEVGVPVSSTIRDYLVESLEGDDKIIMQRQFDFIELVTENSSPINLVYPPKHGDIRQLLQDTVDEVLYKVLTPQEAAEKFMSKANEILGEE